MKITDCNSRGETACASCNGKENQMTQCSACYGRGLIAHRDGSDTMYDWQTLLIIQTKIKCICRLNKLLSYVNTHAYFLFSFFGRCKNCSGKGILPCAVCISKGSVKCNTCEGHGSLLARSIAVVKWLLLNFLFPNKFYNVLMLWY